MLDAAKAHYYVEFWDDIDGSCVKSFLEQLKK